MNQHWTDQDFLNKLYEVGPADAHLESCPECRLRWQQFENSRRQLVERQPEVPAGMLAEQRARIQARIEGAPRRSPFLRWSPAMAMVAMAFFAVIWKQPAPTAPPVQKRSIEKAATKTDAQLMAEIYNSVYETEPGAVQTVEGLFEAKR